MASVCLQSGDDGFNVGRIEPRNWSRLGTFRGCWTDGKPTTLTVLTSIGSFRVDVPTGLELGRQPATLGVGVVDFCSVCVMRLHPCRGITRCECRRDRHEMKSMAKEKWSRGGKSKIIAHVLFDRCGSYLACANCRIVVRLSASSAKRMVVRADSIVSLVSKYNVVSTSIFVSSNAIRCAHILISRYART